MLNNQTPLLSVVTWSWISMDCWRRSGKNSISSEYTPKSQTCSPTGLTRSSLQMIEMDAQLKVSANKSTETCLKSLNSLRYGVKVVSLYHKKWDWVMSLKMKTCSKFTKAKQKAKSRNKGSNKTKTSTKKSNQQKRRKSD